jgi:hypothetical protein
VWLSGYWQDLSYVQGQESFIRDSLRLQSPIGATAREWQSKIASMHSVCVHVRRGDYVSEPLTNSVHGMCGREYFQKAMAQLRANLTACHFFVFSDDPAWAAEHVASAEDTTLVQFASDNRKDIEEFELMRACRHFIISNSTFSWWPAWLGQNADKRVIAPLRWFADGREVNLFPLGWTRL